MSAIVTEGNVRDVPAATWSDRNQRWLSARIEFWRVRLERQQQTPEMPIPAIAEDPPGFVSAAGRLQNLFGLSSFETELLVLAAGVEIDAGLRRAVGAVLSTAAREPVRATFSLALSLLPGAHWDAISPVRPLRHWSLIEFDLSRSVADAVLRIDERVLHALTGVAAFDDRLQGVARLIDVERIAYPDLSRRIAREIELIANALVIIVPATAEAAALRAECSLAAAALAVADCRAIEVDVVALSTDARELAEMARRIDREAALSTAGIVLVSTGEGPLGASAVRFINAVRSPMIVVGPLPPRELAMVRTRAIRRFDIPADDEIAGIGLPPAIIAAAQRACQQFKMGAAVIEQALAPLAPEAAAGKAGTEAPKAALDDRVWDALRESARGGLDALAQRIEAQTTLADLVLPPAVAAQLREIAGQLQHRFRVHDEWGFGARSRRGLGLAALFAGESGTGKTLAAEAIANAARVDLYRIDLAGVVSKYIGETEKNLARVFEAAERSGAVLLFDEADALFGKRSEVKDSHDRYANIEISYLLQRIESYRGLAILTTNMKGSLDRAFLRRIRFVVQFPFPDEAAREQIWRREVPATAPLGAVDFRALAKLQLPGGHIRSVALNAAFLAARRGGAIEQTDFVAAARSEFAKLERTFVMPVGELA